MSSAQDDETKRHREYCFTWFLGKNPDFVAMVGHLRAQWNLGLFKYLIFGHEICPETKNKHLQGFMWLVEGKTMKSLQKKLPGIHLIEKSEYSTQQQNKIYCSKDGDFEEYGQMEPQGKRNDIHKVKKIIRAGGTMQDVIEVATSYQALKTAELLMKYIQPKRRWKTEVYWYWGPTGSGKSARAWDLYPDAYTANENYKWWDGYDNQKCVIIDDFRANWCPFTYFLKLIDRYPFTVETKGSTRQFLADTIIITTPYPPLQTFEQYATEEDLGQITRRITEIREFKNI